MTIYRLVATGHTPGEIFTFGVHVQKVGGSVELAEDAWHTALNLLWNGVATPADSIKQLVSTTVGVDQSSATELSAIDGRNLSQSLQGETLVGTATGEPLPPQVSAVVTLRTALANRSGRGRFYLPPYTVDQVIADRLDATSQGETVEAAQGMIQSLNGAGYEVIVYHRLDFTGTVVTGIDVGDVYGTQRRRRNKLIPSRQSLSV